MGCGRGGEVLDVVIGRGGRCGVTRGVVARGMGVRIWLGNRGTKRACEV